MLPLLVIALAIAFYFLIRLSARVDDLKDLILWYRRFLADRTLNWEDIERSRLVSYQLQPELRPYGAYREGQGVKEMQFVTSEEATTFSRTGAVVGASMWIRENAGGLAYCLAFFLWLAAIFAFGMRALLSV